VGDYTVDHGVAGKFAEQSSDSSQGTLDMPRTVQRKKTRDIEKSYPKAAFVAKLRRFADAIERNERFVIHIAGERVYVPARARFNIEHERGADEEEVEFQIKWKPEAD
jgi:amphi-Trp domain-containing protein